MGNPLLGRRDQDGGEVHRCLKAWAKTINKRASFLRSITSTCVFPEPPGPTALRRQGRTFLLGSLHLRFLGGARQAEGTSLPPSAARAVRGHSKEQETEAGRVSEPGFPQARREAPTVRAAAAPARQRGLVTERPRGQQRPPSQGETARPAEATTAAAQDPPPRGPLASGPAPSEAGPNGGTGPGQPDLPGWA